MTNPPKSYTIRDQLAAGLFWSWNLIFLAFMAFGFAPNLLPNLFTSVRTGMIPLNYLIYALVIVCIPVAAVLLGFSVLRRHPARLFALGYVVEGPLMLLLIVRFFLIRQMTPGVVLLMAVALLGMAAFLWHLLDPQIEKRGPWLGFLRLFGLTLMLVASLYVAVWIAFYALPLITMGLNWLGETLRNLGYFFEEFGRDLSSLLQEGLTWIPLIVLGFILLLYTATLFVLAPVVAPWLTIRAWWQNLRYQAFDRGWILPAVLASLTVAGCVVLFVFANRQPQKRAFTLLDSPPQSPQQAQALLKRQESIRAGLLNSYLAPFRYVSAVGEVRHVSRLYQDTFNLRPQRAYAVQSAYEGLTRPLLYDPVYRQTTVNRQDNQALQDEPRQAARLYQQFFDQTIVEGERQQIVEAVRDTWSGDQAEQAWQAIDEREVQLLSQEVNISEFGEWAEVELYEVYQNQTSDQQEVIYYFNLPESAVITGVWLGDSPDRSQRYPFRIAPRGAAQAVYRDQTRQMKDPALLEQIGPRQYRLRAYPVPPIRVTWNENRSRQLTEEGNPFHMWLTYRVLRTEDGWPMPQLAYHRNVYWDDSTQRLVNGEPLQVDSQTWLPASLPASGSSAPQTQRADLPGGWSVVAQPVEQVTLPGLPDRLSLAVVLDRSRSMAEHSDLASAALERIADLAQPPVDVYLTSSPFRGEEPSRVSLSELDTGNILYYGGQNAGQLLEQFDQLRQDRRYDAVLVLTDGSGYELGEFDLNLPAFDMPLWVVHLGSEIPLGYDDQTLEAIQSSGGGVAGDLDTSFQRLAMGLSQLDPQSASSQYIADVVDGFVWSILPTEQAQAAYPDAVVHSADSDFMALAARRLVLAEMQLNRGQLDQLETLDWLHALAQEYGIVTPYSSMIVLVNETQHQILDHLEQVDDRYQREVEALNDTTPATSMPLTGVPEPHEWLLIGLAVAMLIYYVYTQRKRLALGSKRY